MRKQRVIKRDLVARPETFPCFDVETTLDAKVLDVQLVGPRGNGNCRIWILEPEKGHRTVRTFATFTDDEWFDGARAYVGTFQAGVLTWHLFEMRPHWRPEEDRP